MGDDSNKARVLHRPVDSGEAAAEAKQLLARWRGMGFDSIVCHSSGLCCPANSATRTDPIPEGYFAYPIDSTDALVALAQTIRDGAIYRH